MKIRKEIKAQALIFVFFLIFIVGALAAALLHIWESEVRIPSLQQGALDAFYIAQAGIEIAKSQLRNNWDWSGMDTDNDDIADDSEKNSFGAGSYWVDILSRDDSDPLNRRIIISSDGWSAASHQIIRVELLRTETNPGPPPTYNYSQIGWSWQQK